MPTPWNNPYIPGDPFSYDLKWLVKKLKEHGLTLSEIMEKINDSENVLEKKAFVYNVKDYGAVGDQVTNDTEAIKTCYEKAKETGGVIFFPPGKYLTSEPLQFDDPGVNVFMEGSIYFPLSGKAITIGSLDHANTGMQAVLRTEGASYETTGSTGVELLNLNASTIQVLYSVNYETGVHVIGNTRGTQNNVITLGEITKTKNGIVLDAVNGGFCNDNLFIGGRFTKFGSISATTNGIVITSNDAYYNNNNVFIKPNIENCDNGIVVEYGRLNHFYDVRFEAVDNALSFSNDSQNNEIICGDSDVPEVSAVNTVVQARRRTQMRKELNTIALDSFATNAVCNATNGCVKDFLYFNTTALTFVPVTGRFIYNLDGDYIKLPSASIFGMLLDIESDGTDVFYFNPIEKNLTSRGVVYMLDENGTEITTLPETFSEAGGSSYVSHNATMTRFSASSLGYVFVVPQNCKKIFVGVETSAETSFKSMIVKTSAAVTLNTHALSLPAVPTSAGAYRGQTVTDINGTYIWTWNGTSWSVTV